MKKILIVVAVILISGLLVYLGNQYYKTYQTNKYIKEYELNSFRFDQLVDKESKKYIKTNDLIFLCELRKGLWNTDVSVDSIAKEAEGNSARYKNFVKKISLEIGKDKEMKEFIGNDINTQLIGTLCTRIDPDSQNDRSIYGDLLNKKYSLTGSFVTIGSLEMNEINEEDLTEYQKAKAAEERFRKKF